MYGNRSLDIAKSRYLIHLSSIANSGPTPTTDPYTGAKTYTFLAPNVFNIDPKFQTCVARVKDLTFIAPADSGPPSSEVEETDPTAPHAVDLDGANDHIEFTNLTGGTENVLLWTTNWSIGVSLNGLTDVSSDQLYMTLFSRGGNAIYLRRGGSNWGVYITYNSGTTKTGANTWFAPTITSKLLFTYDSSNHRLKYYLDGTLRGTINVPSSFYAQPLAFTSDNLYAGKGTANELHWDGGLDNLIVSDMTLVGPQIQEYFNNLGDISTHDEYFNDLTTHATLGEDDYPNVSDSKGNAQGTHVNGEANDFVPLEAEAPAEEEASADEPTLTPAAAYKVYLESASLPNSLEISTQQLINPPNHKKMIGQTKLLGVFPLIEQSLDPQHQTVALSYQSCGDVATQGTLIGGTLLNEAIKLTIVPEPVVPEARADYHWYMTLEIQLLCNETERVDTIN